MIVTFKKEDANLPFFLFKLIPIPSIAGYIPLQYAAHHQPTYPFKAPYGFFLLRGLPLIN